MMKKKKKRISATFSIKCISCGETIRENVSNESLGQCLKCFYRAVANWSRTQRRVPAGEFVSDR